MSARTRGDSCLRRVAAAGLVVASLVGTPVAAGAQVDEPRPGVYVQELPSGPDIVGLATGVTVIVGRGTPVGSTGAGPIQVSSPDGLGAVVSDPSPALASAVSDFFDMGGEQASLLLTADEQATSITGALSTVADWKGWDLLVVPALGDLSDGDWLAVAGAMTSTADSARAVALLDPPADAVAAAPGDGGAALVAVAQQLRDSTDTPGAAALYSSGLLDGDGATVATAPAAAGVIAATDASSGPWSAPGGPDHPLAGLTPALQVDNALAATFDAAGITPVMSLPQYGTVLMGARTLALTPDQECLTDTRTLDYLESSITVALDQYVFADNDEATWADVTDALSTFLTSVWQAGGLAGATADDAFSVEVGLDTTMTAQDILDGYMVVGVTLMLGDPAQPVELMFRQEMQSS